MEEKMNIQPEVTLKGVVMTPNVDKLLKKGMAGLEKVCDYMVSAHIAIERLQGRHQTGDPFRMQIDIRIPDRPDIIVERISQSPKKESGGRVKNEPLYVQHESDIVESDDGDTGAVRKRPLREEPVEELIRKTFESARRELDKTVDKQRRRVKTPAQQQDEAIIEKLYRDKEYGFLRAIDGQQIYFHKNSVLHNHWDRLTAGTAVRYTSELGEKGLQASTVELVNKPGVAEQHDDLHDLAKTN
jgi:cold shock CspA family protein